MATLYLNGYGTEANLDDRRVNVTRFDEEKDDVFTLRAPLFDLDRVVVVGRPNVTIHLLQRFAIEGIPVAFITTRGRWLGGLYPNRNGHALRRIRQYELARSDSAALAIATGLITAKIRNMRRVLQRLAANRDRSRDPEQLDVSNSLLRTMHDAQEAESLDSLRGYEGLATALYFRRLAAFFPEETPFNGRNRRPPRDAANALLSWTYTIVLGEVDAAVRCAGLDPCLGFMHEIAYGRPSLALDLLEPLRAPLCDMLVLHLLNHRVLGKEDFEVNSEDGGTYLRAQARKTFFGEYERTMHRRFAPAKNESHTNFRQVIRSQVHAVLHAMENRAEGTFFHMP